MIARPHHLEELRRLLRAYPVVAMTAPRLTPSMRSAIADLGLSRLEVIHAGPETFPMAKGVRAVAAGRLLQGLPLPRRA